MRPGWGVARLALLLVLAMGASGCPRWARQTAEKVDLRDALPEESVGPVPYDRAELEGNATLITFFATWCLPCFGQLGLVGDFQEKYGERGLRVVAVGMDLEGRRVLTPFSEMYAQNFPVVVADEALRSQKGPFGHIKVLPSTVILDRRGEVVVAWEGLAEAADVRREVERALSR